MRLDRSQTSGRPVSALGAIGEALLIDEIAESFTALFWMYALSLPLYVRSTYRLYPERTKLCTLCRYPNDGLPDGACCPECGGNFVIARSKREFTYSVCGAVCSGIVLLSCWMLHLTTPRVWAWFYRAEGWTWMTADKVQCAYRFSGVTGTGIVLATLGLVIYTRALANPRPRHFVYAAGVLMLLWFLALRTSWNSGAIFWHGLWYSAI
jgi:hypothetical protein